MQTKKQGISWRRPTLPERVHSSTIGASGLNYRVRDGTGCTPAAYDTNKSPCPVCAVVLGSPATLLLFFATVRRCAHTAHTQFRHRQKAPMVRCSAETTCYECERLKMRPKRTILCSSHVEQPSTISTGSLNASRRLHVPPIQEVVYLRSYSLTG